MAERQNTGAVRTRTLRVATGGMLFLALLGGPGALWAGENTVRAGVGWADIMTVAGGLGLVLLVIFGCAWMVRRIGLAPSANTSHIKVLAVLAVGSRERITLIEVGGKQLLLGVTANQINTLHSFDEPVVDSTKIKNNSEFAQKLHQLVSRSS